ncbi:hypothetical protein F8388_004104 [Cannabis sativa]|uniref:Uncharacterized protein n=1 Tax=Cannabis sativa TaxID=3483 RepID=A0A7J6DJJ6_CANSA|nr:hypothetical protein G4B88_008650 [Cannabis sativa]KAF4348864.1 hypothetical protein F8388_025149 [Cannabis sativa]KAF4372894.1 hypothetical protein F8388_004104 [Cannabis sativa]KAF4379537.1 hypothetical protein G4B88_028779 [Cannabis sativa]
MCLSGSLSPSPQAVKHWYKLNLPPKNDSKAPTSTTTDRPKQVLSHHFSIENSTVNINDSSLSAGRPYFLSMAP